MYHWTNKRIKGHIATSFMAYTMLIHLRNSNKLQYREIAKCLKIAMSNETMPLKVINQTLT